MFIPEVSVEGPKILSRKYVSQEVRLELGEAMLLEPYWLVAIQPLIGPS